MQYNGAKVSPCIALKQLLLEKLQFLFLPLLKPLKAFFYYEMAYIK